MDDIIDTLLNSPEPSVRFKTLVHVMGNHPAATKIRDLAQSIKSSLRVRTLLSERDRDGRIPADPHKKWYGAHWVLACLADIGYPPGDNSLVPLREQVCNWLLSKRYEEGIRCIEGRTRKCVAREGNAVFSFLSLGLADTRTDELVERIIRWQWPDGGWNCDKRPAAANSSFMETLIPLRALALYVKRTGHRQAKQAAERAAEVFLKRHLFRRQQDGSVISKDFIRLHYPCYYHYDIIFGLKVMSEAGFLDDPRCADALEELQGRQLPDGGFPADYKYFHVTDKKITGRSLVNWGGVSKTRMNEWVTVDALHVLKQAGRLKAVTSK